MATPVLKLGRIGDGRKKLRAFRRAMRDSLGRGVPVRDALQSTVEQFLEPGEVWTGMRKAAGFRGAMRDALRRGVPVRDALAAGVEAARRIPAADAAGENHGPDGRFTSTGGSSGSGGGDDKSTHETLEKVAKEHLNVPTLQNRRSDHLDFHERGVGQLGSALHAAYSAGSGGKKAHSATIARIAKQHLGVPTLKSRGSDHLDFHEHHVHELRKALHAAHAAGVAKR